MGALTLLAFLGGGSVARAQEIEPRAYSNAPVGVNFLIVGAAATRGGVSLDPSVPLTNANIDTSNGVLAYARVLDLWGRSGKFDAVVPYAKLSGTAEFAGEPVERRISGFANPSFRLSMNLCGAPALSLKQFAGYRQDVIVGVSLQVSAPFSQYDPSRLVNLGTNRWAFKPELGISKAVDRWTLETQLALTVYTDNTDFFGGSTKAQDPVLSWQGHVAYNFGRGSWASFDVTYFNGGRTTIDGTLKNDLQQNWRIGGTLAMPVNARNSIKIYASSGVSARTGNNFDLVGLAWQHRWGGGL
jgi:hypothetical protein